MKIENKKILNDNFSMYDCPIFNFFSLQNLFL